MAGGPNAKPYKRISEGLAHSIDVSIKLAVACEVSLLTLGDMVVEEMLVGKGIE